MTAEVETIADAVLFEGYLLYPYRTSALKNRQRFTFGVLAPREGCATSAGERWCAQSECLVRGGPTTAIEVVVRFLHPMRRLRSVIDEDSARERQGGLVFDAGGAFPVESGEEATVVRLELRELRLEQLVGAGVRHSFDRPGRDDREPIHGPDGRLVGEVRRSQESLRGTVELRSVAVDESTHRLRVRVENVTPPGDDATAREPIWRSFASTHWILGARGGELLSQLDPPAELREAAAACRNDGVWPVRVRGNEGKVRVLCSPIILDDDPRVAPESPGDAFDATEIDELLALRILTLTPEERRQMAAADPRAAALLARTEGLRPADLARLHGVFRATPAQRAGRAALPPPGARVRLRPRGRRDAFDLLLAGRCATVLSIERDYDDRDYVTVTVDDDPGADLGMEGKPGHRFFFLPDELEPLAEV